MSDPKKILIIEDDDDMIEAMKLALKPTRCEILASLTPEEGFEKAKIVRPDLIILDVMFGASGKMKGFDYAIKMKQEKSLAAIPILMITAVNQDDSRFVFSPQTDQEYLPVDDFIDKPPQPDDLVKRVEKLLAQKTSIWVNWPAKSAA